MKSELQERLNDLGNRWKGGGIEIDFAISEDFKVEEVYLLEETLCISYCGSMMYDFPIGALCDDFIEEILVLVQIEVEREKDAVDKVLDANYWASI